MDEAAEAARAAAYAANHATTGDQPTERDLPILMEALERIINLLGTAQIVDASLKVLDAP